MSMQRRRGLPVKVWKGAEVEDRRGNTQWIVDTNRVPDYTVHAASTPQRSARAEVPGQAQINIVRLLLPLTVTVDDEVIELVNDISLWSEVEFLGRRWDIVTPLSARMGGSRKTRHISIDIRERP